MGHRLFSRTPATPPSPFCQESQELSAHNSDSASSCPLYSLYSHFCYPQVWPQKPTVASLNQILSPFSSENRTAHYWPILCYPNIKYSHSRIINWHEHSTRVLPRTPSFALGAIGLGGAGEVRAGLGPVGCCSQKPPMEGHLSTCHLSIGTAAFLDPPVPTNRAVGRRIDARKLDEYKTGVAPGEKTHSAHGAQGRGAEPGVCPGRAGCLQAPSEATPAS